MENKFWTMIWERNVVGKSKSWHKKVDKAFSSHFTKIKPQHRACEYCHLVQVTWFGESQLGYGHPTHTHDPESVTWQKSKPMLHLYSKLLFWPTFHLLTCSRRELWPLLQPTTRGQRLGSCNVVYRWMSVQGDTDPTNCHVVINF